MYVKGNSFSPLALLARSNGWGAGDLSKQAVQDKMIMAIALLHHHSQRFHTQTYLGVHNSDKDSIYVPFG